ncbi:DUF1304 domain-containing protein, partial [Mesorhizobium sp. M0199]
YFVFAAGGLSGGFNLGYGFFLLNFFFVLGAPVPALSGAATAGRKILFIQTVPAMLALIALALC